MNSPDGEAARDLHSALVESLGLAIATGKLAPHTVLRLDEVEAQHGVSRSVVREAIRVLGSLGMLESRRRWGTVVQPEHSWNLFDPLVIRWRLASSKRLEQLRSLSELRGAVEPQAAKLAAQRASARQRSELVGQAAQLWAAGQAGDLEEFLRLDSDFHGALLRASGNPMFSQLHGVVTEVLAGRTQHGLMPERPQGEALQLHVEVANAIQRGDPGAAESAMHRIVEQSTEEMAVIWADMHAPAQIPAGGA